MRKHFTPEMVTRILKTLGKGRFASITVPGKFSNLRFQQALGQHFARNYPDVRLHTRTEAPGVLLCWVTPQVSRQTADVG